MSIKWTRYGCQTKNINLSVWQFDGKFRWSARFRLCLPADICKAGAYPEMFEAHGFANDEASAKLLAERYARLIWPEEFNQEDISC